MNENKRGFRAKKHKVAAIEPSKPRNFVAKNAAKGGAGAHKDKKKAVKQGDTKHKKDYAEHLESMLQNVLTETRQINETGLDPVRRMKAIQFIVSKTGWERNYVELASDEELMDLYVKIKNGEPVGEGVAEGDNPEYDDEAGMSDNNLETLKRSVAGIDELIQPGDNLPEWCQEKIAVANSMLVTVWDYMLSEKDSEQGAVESIDEGAKVDRQAMHITKSMMKRHNMSRDDAEAAAWAHIKHPKKKKKARKEGWTTDTLAAQLFEQEITYEDKLQSMLNKKIK